jgi:biopolymer transport protein ExbD
MKTIHIIATMLVTLIALDSCTPKMTFVTSSLVPAASGAANVKKDKNKNYVINVNVQNLAEPKNLSPSKNIYLVWMESNETSAKKLGQLMPNGKALKATLSATSVDQPKRVYITAEDNADVQYPDGQVILTTQQ